MRKQMTSAILADIPGGPIRGFGGFQLGMSLAIGNVEKQDQVRPDRLARRVRSCSSTSERTRNERGGASHPGALVDTSSGGC